MKILLLNKNDTIYSSNAYLVLGEWSRLEDINTLIDTGADGSILEGLEAAYTGVGKKKVDQVILTHNHFDHTGNLLTIKKQYGPKVYAFSPGSLVDKCLKDGQKISIGDRTFEVIHTPGHSSDSICLYCEEEGVLFSGDTPLNIMTKGGGYGSEYIRVLEFLSKKNIRMVFPGHNQPVREKVQEMIAFTVKNVKAGRCLSCSG